MGKRTRIRMMQNGLYDEPKDHFEMWIGAIYVPQPGKRQSNRILVPVDVVRHLQLNNKDKIVIAIKRAQE